MTNATTLRSLRDLLRDEWFISVLCGYLPLQDCRSLIATNSQIRNSFHAFVSLWPAAMQEAFYKWPPRGSRVIVVGCHGARVGSNGQTRSTEHMLDESITRASNNNTRLKNPAPIIQISLDYIAIDMLDGNLLGNPRSQIVPANTPPLEMGRMQPAVCMISSSQIFYCGGTKVLTRQEDNNPDHDFQRRNTSAKITATFDFKTLMWHRLPDMPRGRVGAKACKVGNKVLVFGGTDNTYSRLYSILCFDLTKGRWLTEEEHGIPHFPGESFTDFAIGSNYQNDTVIIAGGKRASLQIFFDDGNAVILAHYSREVFSLSLSQLCWEKLPQLPESVRIKSGTVVPLAPPMGEDYESNPGRYEFRVTDGENVLGLVEGASDWEELITKSPDNSTPGDQCSSSSHSMVQNCHSKLLLDNDCFLKLYAEDTGKWISLPPNHTTKTFRVDDELESIWQNAVVEKELISASSFAIKL